MPDALLALEGVHTHIGAYHILHGVELSVKKGGITVLLGRNGAGKTTTLRTIMGLWRPSRGALKLAGRDITRLSTPEIARQGIGYVPEEMGVFRGLTVRENMEVASRSGPMDPSRLDWIFALFPALETFWQRPAGALSGGQKQMLAIAVALIEPKKLILIDEPTKGLAPAIVEHMVEAFRQLKASETTILLVEQNFGFVSSLGDAVAVMDEGKVVHSGRMADLVEDEAAQQRLLGLSLDAEP